MHNSRKGMTVKVYWLDFGDLRKKERRKELLENRIVY
jgi:hypothetical protein